MTALERSVRRALAARVLRGTEIAAQFGCSREYVSRLRARMRHETRTIVASATGKGER